MIPYSLNPLFESRSTSGDLSRQAREGALDRRFARLLLAGLDRLCRITSRLKQREHRREYESCHRGLINLWNRLNISSLITPGSLDAMLGMASAGLK